MTPEALAAAIARNRAHHAAQATRRAEWRARVLDDFADTDPALPPRYRGPRRRALAVALALPRRPQYGTPGVYFGSIRRVLVVGRFGRAFDALAPWPCIGSVYRIRTAVVRHGLALIEQARP